MLFWMILDVSWPVKVCIVLLGSLHERRNIKDSFTCAVWPRNTTHLLCAAHPGRQTAMAIHVESSKPRLSCSLVPSSSIHGDAVALRLRGT